MCSVRWEVSIAVCLLGVRWGFVLNHCVALHLRENCWYHKVNASSGSFVSRDEAKPALSSIDGVAIQERSPRR